MASAICWAKSSISGSSVRWLEARPSEGGRLALVFVRALEPFQSLHVIFDFLGSGVLLDAPRFQEAVELIVGIDAERVRRSSYLLRVPAW